MNVLIISHMYPSQTKKINGVFVHEQIKALINKGHHVKVVSPLPYVPPFLKTFSPKWKSYNATPYKDVIDGIDIYYPNHIVIPRNIHFHTSGMRMYMGIRNTVKKIHEEFKFDVIHAHVALPDGDAALRLAKNYKVPLITTIHGQDLQHTIHKNIKCKNKVSNVVIESNKTILVSNKLNEIRKHYLPDIDDEKFKVIPNGVSNLFLNNNKTPTDEITINILSVSNLLTTKGIDLTIQAISAIAKEYPNVIYRIIGDGAEKDRLIQQVKELNIEEHVEFLGQKSSLEVATYMSQSDIFLLPSWNEAFGVVYIEAMASGLPVIGCKGEGIEDIVDDGVEGYLVHPKDVQDIVNKTMQLIANPEKRVKMGMRARVKVEEKFTWNQLSSELVEVYEAFI